MEISDAVNRFREYGYPILLDDFGSGFFYAKPMAVEDFEMLYDKIGSKIKQE